MKFGLKWVHVARCELILRLDGALWLRIIFKPLLTPKRAINLKNDTKNWLGSRWYNQWFTMHLQMNPLEPRRRITHQRVEEFDVMESRLGPSEMEQICGTK